MIPRGLVPRPELARDPPMPMMFPRAVLIGARARAGGGGDIAQGHGYGGTTAFRLLKPTTFLAPQPQQSVSNNYPQKSRIGS
jgi:hypothetical protein